MNFFWRGFIKSSKRVRHANRECYGLTRGQRNKFKIYISEKVTEDIDTFGNTILHELLHLYFCLLMAFGVRGLTEDLQHEVIEPMVPLIQSHIAAILSRKKKK
jgi:hypothetical protein